MISATIKRAKRPSPQGWPATEFVLISAAVIAGMVVFVAWAGGTFVWDGLNHHLYLGRQVWGGSRLAWDYFAAGPQSCQYPHGYALLAGMVDAGWPGTLVFGVLAGLAGLVAPAAWVTTWCLLPGRGWRSLTLRTLGVLLACSGVLYWKLLVQTSNDLAGTVLGLWAVALCLLSVDAARWERRPALRLVLCAIAGALVGFAVVIKVTHAIGVVSAAAVLLFVQGSWKVRAACWLLFGLGGLTVAVLTGWQWAMQTWTICGSPVHPLGQDFFSGRTPLVEILP